MIILNLPSAIYFEPTPSRYEERIGSTGGQILSTKDKTNECSTARALDGTDGKSPKTNQEPCEGNTGNLIKQDTDIGNAGDSDSSLQAVESVKTPNYSSAYVKHNTSAVISQIKNLVEEWSKKGTSGSISEISQIKDLLENNAQYLEQTPESRVLLGGLEGIFDGDRWENLDSEKLAVISSQLEQFRSGNVTWESLKKFSRAIWSAEIA